MVLGQMMVISRFGVSQPDLVPLEAYGLEEKWSRLHELQQEATRFIGLYSEKVDLMINLESQRQAAYDEDTEAYAQALRAGKDKPKASRVRDLEKKLEMAARDRDALQRASEAVIGEIAEFKADHAAELQDDVREIVEQRARELADHARETDRLFNEVEAGAAVLEALTPPEPAGLPTGPGQDLVNVWGPITTKMVSAVSQRTTILEVLQHLQGIAPPEQQPWARPKLQIADGQQGAEETVVGAVPDEDDE